MDADSSLPWYRVINSQGKISLSKLNDQGQNIQAQLLLAEGILSDWGQSENERVSVEYLK